jgi:tetratricopeptide (TPR) repeat protein
MNSRDVTEQERKFNEHYQAGWALLKQMMPAGTTKAVHVSVEKARQAVAHFRQCLALDPGSWPCMWAAGKAEQARGNHREALQWFEQAAQLETANADVWREAALAAGALGEPTKAVKYAVTALNLKPDDAGLHANAGLAFMLAGDDARAAQMVSRACELDPTDSVNRSVARLVEDVRAGVRDRPRSI